MSNFDRTWFFNRLEEFAEEGRDVQLFGPYGQTIFPIYQAGEMLSDVAVFLILRGSGDRAPASTTPFPTNDEEILTLGQGWIVMCVRLPNHFTAHEKIAKIQRAEEKLRAMKSGRSGGENAA